MAVYKDKWNGYSGDTWRVACYYKDWKEVNARSTTRGDLQQKKKHRRMNESF